MPVLLWDASALSKRHIGETGSAVVNALFAIVATADMRVTVVGFAETAAIFRRKLNQGSLAAAEFQIARQGLRHEVLHDLGFELLSVTDADFLDGIDLVDRHNLNSTDAAILALFLRYVRSQPPGSPACVLVAADRRLLRAAALEGLPTLNPEALAPTDVPAYLAAL